MVKTAGLLTCVVSVLAPRATGRPVIAVAPVGEVSAQELSPLLRVLRETFGAEVVAAPAVPLPPAAYDARRRQHLSTALLDGLARARRPGWDRLLGVADVHELGHSYGLGHCNDPHCVIWFSNSLAETDRKGTAFCVAHAAELRRLTTRP